MKVICVMMCSVVEIIYFGVGILYCFIYWKILIYCVSVISKFKVVYIWICYKVCCDYKIVGYIWRKCNFVFMRVFWKIFYYWFIYWKGKGIKNIWFEKLFMFIKVVFSC